MSVSLSVDRNKVMEQIADICQATIESQRVLVPSTLGSRKRFLVVSAPMGTGKTTLLELLREWLPERFDCNIAERIDLEGVLDDRQDRALLQAMGVCALQEFGPDLSLAGAANSLTDILTRMKKPLVVFIDNLEVVLNSDPRNKARKDQIRDCLLLPLLHAIKVPVFVITACRSSDVDKHETYFKGHTFIDARQTIPLENTPDEVRSVLKTSNPDEADFIMKIAGESLRVAIELDRNNAYGWWYKDLAKRMEFLSAQFEEYKMRWPEQQRQPLLDLLIRLVKLEPKGYFPEWPELSALRKDPILGPHAQKRLNDSRVVIYNGVKYVFEPTFANLVLNLP
jgi:hypothetical protein